jgi:PKD repeat protein
MKPQADTPESSNNAPPQSQEYRHLVDMRFTTPKTLGRRYVVFWMGKDQRATPRLHHVPAAVRRRNRWVAAFFIQMAVAWCVAVVFAFAWFSQIGCGANLAPGIGEVAGGSGSGAPGDSNALIPSLNPDDVVAPPGLHEDPQVTLVLSSNEGTAPCNVSATATIAVDPQSTLAQVDVDWGDGSTPGNWAGIPPGLSHSYTQPGSYAILASATDSSGAIGSTMAPIQVNGPEILACDLSVTQSGSGDTEAGRTVSFAVSAPSAAPGVASWSLDFGDGTPPATGTETTKDVPHTYEIPGDYTALLMVEDATGRATTSAKSVALATVANKAPTGTLTLDKTTGLAPLTVSATGTGSDPDGTIVEYRLDFDGNGSIDWKSASPPTNVTFTYTVVKSYGLRFYVVDNKGAIAQKTAVITVQKNWFTVSPTSLSFAATTGALTLGIYRANTMNTVSWACSAASSWVKITPTSGTNTGSVKVTIDRAQIGAGTFKSSIQITSNGGLATVPVTVTNTGPVLSVTPASMDFGATTTSIGFTVANTGGGTLTWSCTPSAAWMQASPASGSGPGSAMVTVDRTKLPVGRTSGKVTVNSNGGIKTITVYATVKSGGMNVTVQ